MKPIPLLARAILGSLCNRTVPPRPSCACPVYHTRRRPYQARPLRRLLSILSFGCCPLRNSLLLIDRGVGLADVGAEGCHWKRQRDQHSRPIPVSLQYRPARSRGPGRHREGVLPSPALSLGPARVQAECRGRASPDALYLQEQEPLSLAAPRARPPRHHLMA